MFILPFLDCLFHIYVNYTTPTKITTPQWYNRYERGEIMAYTYHFPVEGILEDKDADAARLLGDRLRDSLDFYDVFLQGSKAFDYISFDGPISDTPLKIDSIDIHTNSEIYENAEERFMECLEENLSQILPNMKLTGTMEVEDDGFAKAVENISDTEMSLS